MKRYASDALLGVINSTIIIPVCISFCSIIFRDQAFVSFIPLLVKLVLFSSAIHQICFTLNSSLPFAVGQVQDAGLIFLSHMACNIVATIDDKQNLIPTTLFVLAIATAGLGAMLMIIGKFQLAHYIQYLPLPVIGGYLAYIGFFCGEAGLAMMGGVQITGIRDWVKFAELDTFLHILPGTIIGISMYHILGWARSPYALPLCMATILIVFYSILWLSGHSLQDARDLHWVMPLEQEASYVEAWSLYDFSRIEFQQLFPQFFTWTGMWIIVAFSSCLDVAAIEMELGLPLDYNWELRTVGFSNFVSGLCGGYSGSYIFTQTIFCMRRGVSTKACGLVIAAFELFVVFSPISVTSLVPKFFFGSLLVLISTDLIIEWLIRSRGKMMRREYGVSIMTFFFITMLGMEAGMLVGVILAMLGFVWTYSSMPSVIASSMKRSSVRRTFEEQELLLKNAHQIKTISLSGYIFFGSALSILHDVKAAVVLPEGATSANILKAGTTRSPVSNIIDEVIDPDHGDELGTELHHSNSTASRWNPWYWVKRMLPGGNSGVVAPSESSLLLNKIISEDGSTTKPLYTTLSGGSFDAAVTTHGNASSRIRTVSEVSNSRSATSSGGAPVGNSSRSVYDLDPEEFQALQKQWSQVRFADNRKASFSSVMSSFLEGEPIGSIVRESNVAIIPGHDTNSTTKGLIDPPAPPLTSPIKVGFHPLSKGSQRHDFSALCKRRHTEIHSRGDMPNSIVPRSFALTQPLSQIAESTSPRSPSGESPPSTSAATNAYFQRNSNGSSSSANNDASSSRSKSDATNVVPNLLRSLWQAQQLDSPLNVVSGSYVAMKSALKKKQLVTPTNQLDGSPSYSSTHQDIEYDVEHGDNAVDNYAQNRLSLQDPTNDESQLTKFLVLDFKAVLGVDATAARSCFLMVVQLMRVAEVCLVFTEMNPSILELLRAHDVIRPDDAVIPTLDDALEWCEEQVLASLSDEKDCPHDLAYYANASSRRSQFVEGTTLHDNLHESFVCIDASDDASRDLQAESQTYPRQSLEMLQQILENYLELDPTKYHPVKKLLHPKQLAKYFHREEFSAGDTIVTVGKCANKLYIVEDGDIEIDVVSGGYGDAVGSPRQAGREIEALQFQSPGHMLDIKRICKLSSGSVFGDVEFFLRKPHQACAYAECNCIVWTIDCDGYARMESEQPQLCILFQHVLLKNYSLQQLASNNAANR